MKILVATDGSKPALNAVKHAESLVRQLSSKSNAITLINVHDDLAFRHAKAFVGRKVVAEYFQELSQKALKPAVKLLQAASVKYSVEVRIGHVAQEIVDHAHKGKFDLLVMGSKGRGGLSDMLLGSVAQRVLASAEIPVLLVK